MLSPTPLDSASTATTDLPRLSSYAAYWTIIVMLGVPLFYWTFTGQVWEDFLITFRASHNLAAGVGLTYEPGTRVHCFTSPLNVLLPAFFDWLTKTESYAVPLALYNLVALAAFAWGGWTVCRLMREQDGRVTPATLLFPLALVLCHRTTAFVVNGQEAGFWVAFLALAFAAVVRGHARHGLAAGLSWAGLMWTRPDSAVHIAIFATVALVFPADTRKAEFRGVARAAGICALGYVPWFLGAWWYYGSPVPHSLQAKIGAYVGTGLPWKPIDNLVRVRDVFGGFVAPIYGLSDKDWGAIWLWGAAALGLIAAVVCVVGRLSRLTRCASACLLGTMAYLGLIWSRGTAFPWYFVPAGFFGVMVLVRLPGELFSSRSARIILAAIPLLVTGQFFVSAVRLNAAQQRLIEDGLRKPLGLWLRMHMAPGERVFLEPIGFIGYFSGALIYDYPGLTSPDVVRLRRKGADFYQLMDQLKPAWMVLRESEFDGLRDRPQIAVQYRIARIFDQRPAIALEPPLRGGNFGGDSKFFVLVRADRRTPSTPRP